MSKFSSKCDLYDHIMMLGGNSNDSIEAELRCFEIFKQRTDGHIYQNYQVVVSENNQSFVKDHNPWFNFTEREIVKKDSRTKTGERKEKKFTYTYLEQTFDSLKKLNEFGVFVQVPIQFDSVLEIIQFYPYLVGMMTSDSEKEKITITQTSYPLMRFKESMAIGGISSWDCEEYYRKKLQQHYMEVCTYLNHKKENNK